MRKTFLYLFMSAASLTAFGYGAGNQNPSGALSGDAQTDNNRMREIIERKGLRNLPIEEIVQRYQAVSEKLVESLGRGSSQLRNAMANFTDSVKNDKERQAMFDIISKPAEQMKAIYRKVNPADLGGELLGKFKIAEGYYRDNHDKITIDNTLMQRQMNDELNQQEKDFLNLWNAYTYQLMSTKNWKAKLKESFLSFKDLIAEKKWLDSEQEKKGIKGIFGGKSKVDDATFHKQQELRKALETVETDLFELMALDSLMQERQSPAYLKSRIIDAADLKGAADEAGPSEPALADEKGKEEAPPSIPPRKPTPPSYPLPPIPGGESSGGESSGSANPPPLPPRDSDEEAAESPNAGRPLPPTPDKPPFRSNG